MRRKKTRYTLTTIGIILGVAVILGISITNLSTVAAFKDTIDAITGKADILINPPTTAGFSDKLLDQVRQTAGVEIANPGISRGSQVLNLKHKPPLEVVGIDPMVDRQLRDYTVKPGRFLKSNDKNVILLGGSFADDHNLKIKDQVILATNKGKRRFKIIGILTEAGAGRFVGGNVAFMPLKTAQAEFNLKGRLSYIDAKIEPRAHAKNVKQRLRRKLGADIIIEEPEKRVEAMNQSLKSLRVGLSFFSAIALFVGGFLIFNTFSMVIVERVVEFGMLRSIGAGRTQIIRLVLEEVLIIGVVGSVLGVALGVGLAKGLLYFMSNTIDMKIAVFKVPIVGLAVSIAIGIIVSLVAAVQPALAAGRISPLQAIRTEARAAQSRLSFRLTATALIALSAGGVVSMAPNLLGQEPGSLVNQAGALLLLLGAALLTPALVKPAAARLRRPAGLFVGIEGRLATDNLGRSRGQTAATVSAVMISLAMLISVGGLTTSFKDSINRWVERSIGADIFVSGQPSDLSFKHSLTKQISKVPGVKLVSPVRFFRVRSGNNWYTWRAIEPETFQKLAQLQFAEGDKKSAWRRLVESDNIFISTVLANRLRLKVGDKLSIKTNHGRHDFNVAAVTIDFGGDSGDVIIGNRKAMKKYFNLTDVNSFRVKVKAGVKPRTITNRIKRRFQRRYSLLIQDNQEFKARINRQITTTFSAFNIIILIAVFVAAIGIINTLMMNIMQRQREIGVLRAIGASKRQIRIIIIVEAAITGLMGFILGLALGIYLSLTMVSSMHALTGYEISYVFPWSTAFISGSIAVVFSTAAAVIPARVAADTNIVEAVQYE